MGRDSVTATPDAAPESLLPESAALRESIQKWTGTFHYGEDSPFRKIDALDLAVAQLRAKLRECEGEREAAVVLLRDIFNSSDWRAPAAPVVLKPSQATYDALAALLAKAGGADGGGTEAGGG